MVSGDTEPGRSQVEAESPDDEGSALRVGSHKATAWGYRVGATLLAMIGVAMTISLYWRYVLLDHHIARNPWGLAAVLVIFTGIFSFVVFGLLEAQQRRLVQLTVEYQRQRDVLQGLWDATGVMSTVLDGDQVLQRMVDVARSLFGAGYAAMSILSRSGPSNVAQFITAGLSEAERDQIGDMPTGRGILGEVMRTKKPLRIRHVAEYRRFSGFPPRHPVMDSFLGVPMVYQGTVLGQLYLTNRPDGFSAQDEMLAQLFANQAAVFIANTQLYQDREQWATVQERERIGRELHDGVLQTLYGLSLSLELLLEENRSLDQEAGRELERMAETLGLIMTDIRMYIQSIINVSVDLLVTVRDMLQRTGGMEDVRFEFRDTRYRALRPELVHDLVMSAQEAVSNARRHGQAEQIVVGWEALVDVYRFWIADNGRGFDTRGSQETQKFGLKNMHRRIVRWHGRLNVTSAIGSGTTVEFIIPLHGVTDQAGDRYAKSLQLN